MNTAWIVAFHPAFAVEFNALPAALQIEMFAHARLLEHFGPSLGRPQVDTLKGSRHANMKELRFAWLRQVWRVAFAFDPARDAILLTAGDKAGADQKRFYKSLIAVADGRFDEHVQSLRPKLRRT